jgi:membrane protein DedA with SNARE-associated domain
VIGALDGVRSAMLSVPMAAISITGHSEWAAYAILFALLALAWAGLPTAGQAALVAAGVLAGEGQLHIERVLIVGTAGSIAGGIVGYVLGLKGGRAAFSRPGPLHGRRLDALESGDRLFARYGAVAAFFVPMWLLGIVRMPWRRFLFWNTVAAIAWTLVGGLGGYFVGPAVTPLLGKATTAIAIAAVVVIGGVWLHRRWRRGRKPADRDAPAD